jgi:NitT/TauT family transport system permease protein
VFAALVVVGVMGVGMYLIFDFFERRMTAWSVRGGDAMAQTIGG